jgi:hypothetical protein
MLLIFKLNNFKTQIARVSLFKNNYSKFKKDKKGINLMMTRKINFLPIAIKLI